MNDQDAAAVDALEETRWGERPVLVGKQTLRCEGCSSGDAPYGLAR